MSTWMRNNVLGLVALFVALGGSAIATTVARNSVTSKSIRNGSVKTKDVKNNNLTGTDIDERTLSEVPTADGSITEAKLADGAVTSAKVADGAVTSAKVADGSITRADTTERWALVDGDGTIVDQSGGISTTHPNQGDYFLDFGSSQAGRSITVTPVFREGDSGFGTSAITTLCGGPPGGAICVEGNDANHVYVGISNDTGSSNDQAFFIRTN